MKLYKYCSPQRIDLLSGGYLHFADLIQFNDPFELNPSVWVTPSAIMPLTRIIAGEIQKVVIDQSGLNWFQRRLQDIAFPFVMLYYAAGHTGFVLEFDTTDSFFNLPINANDAAGLHKIKYSKSRLAVAHGKGLETAHITTKSIEWSYEKEWRLIRQLGTSSTISNQSRNIPFPKTALTKILIGCRAAQQLKSDLANIARTHTYPNLIVEQLRISDVNYRLIDDVLVSL